MYLSVVVEVVVTDEFRGWYEGLAEADADAVYRVVGLLEQRGRGAGVPVL